MTTKTKLATTLRPLLSFPPRLPEPVDVEQLRMNSRRLLELQEIRIEIEKEQREVERSWMQWQKLMERACAERDELLGGLARGAELTG